MTGRLEGSVRATTKSCWPAFEHGQQPSPRRQTVSENIRPGVLMHAGLSMSERSLLPGTHSEGDTRVLRKRRNILTA